VTTGADAEKATVLFLARSSATARAWQSVTLVKTGPGTFSGTATGITDPTIEQYFVQVVDDANNVSVSSKKGQDFAAPATPADSGAPTIAVLGTPVGGSYVGPQTVAITGPGPIRYTLDTLAEADYTGAFVVAGSGGHTVTATGPGGTSTQTFTILGTPAPTVTIASPVDGGSYPPGSPIAAVFRCDGYGVVSCVPNPVTPSTSIGPHTFSVTADDGVHPPTTATVHYSVVYGFVGLLQPVDDGVGQTMSIFKKSSTIPLKFQLLTGTGPLSATASAALAASCDLKVSYQAAGTTSAPVDETAFTAADDSGGCFRWDGSQFQYNFGTKSLKAGTVYQLRIYSVSGSMPDHLLRIGLR
jgi:large repetitive protein